MLMEDFHILRVPLREAETKIDQHCRVICGKRRIHVANVGSEVKTYRILSESQKRTISAGEKN